MPERSAFHLWSIRILVAHWLPVVMGKNISGHRGPCFLLPKLKWAELPEVAMRSFRPHPFPATFWRILRDDFVELLARELVAPLVINFRAIEWVWKELGE